MILKRMFHILLELVVRKSEINITFYKNNTVGNYVFNRLLKNYFQNQKASPSSIDE